MASKYWALLTCRNMSDMHAALDSSKAESTLARALRFLNKGKANKSPVRNSRPYAIDLLFHADLFFLQ
jgi:hypothetical protein